MLVVVQAGDFLREGPKVVDDVNSVFICDDKGNPMQVIQRVGENNVLSINKDDPKFASTLKTLGIPLDGELNLGS